MTVIATTEPDLSGQRLLPTPEGVGLRVQLAGRGERLGAYLLDNLILFLVALGLFLVARFLLFLPVAEARSLAGFVFLSVGRLLWFPIWEVATSGQTPAKKMLRLRVIASDGGPLTLQSLLVRNATREIEIVLPFGLLIQGLTQRLNNPIATGEAQLLAGIALSCILLYPLLSRNRQRLGDVLAGTWVIEQPRPTLFQDFAELVRADEKVAGAAFAFAPQHLDAYGIHELHVLEDVLRRAGDSDPDRKLLADIVSRIQRRSGAEHSVMPGQERQYLSAYYVALRQHLETRKRFGDERRDKGWRRRR